ncbi:hypothetical protein CKAN_02413800 [Cinnamomum micranthum f. kanehirae]|uniref:Uncharacterized protein n=1 Tax=Cinnamomum micranthum f. kanehirae TaxID=337451 RepID=A0A443PVM4_9MAGN|nr:hypothetical protein CKAN_02413800 [Cinnamomum micranthum f. kanehirae]
MQRGGAGLGIKPSTDAWAMAIVRKSKNLPGATALGIHNVGPPLFTPTTNHSPHLQILKKHNETGKGEGLPILRWNITDWDFKE